MISLSPSYVEQTGGILSAIAHKSAEYLRSIIRTSIRDDFKDIQSPPERLIVHAEPHVDEYFAELVFRSALPQAAAPLPILEQTLFSRHNDHVAQRLWPTSAVFGLGAAYAGGVETPYLYDDHADGHGPKVEPSVSQVVCDAVLDTVPRPMQLLLDEINFIDSQGGAHWQHLGNVVKSMHLVPFMFHGESSAEDARQDALHAHWKRAVVDACICAVLHAIVQGIELFDVEKIRAALAEDFGLCEEHSFYRDHACFQEAVDYVRRDYEKVESRLRHDRAFFIAPISGRARQRLILGPVAVAARELWGSRIGQTIMVHFWEAEIQKQISFLRVDRVLNDLNEMQTDPLKVRTEVGLVAEHKLSDVKVNVGRRRDGSTVLRPMMLLSLRAERGVTQPHKAMIRYIKKSNSADPKKKTGVGLILVEHPRGTKYLSAVRGTPPEYWRRVVALLVRTEGRSEEGGAWYVQPSGAARNDDGETADGLPAEIASFVINGNMAHQYVPRSSLDIDSLAVLAKRAADDMGGP